MATLTSLRYRLCTVYISDNSTPLLVVASVVLTAAGSLSILASTWLPQGDDYKTFETAARSFFDADIFDTTNKDVAKLLKLTKPGTIGVARKYFDEWEFVSSEGHEALKEEPEDDSDEEEEEEGAAKKEKKDTSPAGKLAAFFKQEMAKVYTPYDGEAHGKIFEGPIQHYVRRDGDDGCVMMIA